MALLATQSITRSGPTPTYAAVSSADTFLPGARVFIHVKNTNAATRTCTIVSAPSVLGLAIADVIVTVPATTGDKMIGPVPAEYFADPADGFADITWDATSNVTIAVLDLSQP